MSIAKKSETGKGNSCTANSLLDMAGTMDQWFRNQVNGGQPSQTLWFNDK